MHSTYLFSALSLIACLTACSSADKKDPLLEAASFHQQATEIQALVEPKIERIDSLKSILSAKKTTATGAKIATLDSLKLAFEAWEENLVEVPGNATQSRS